MISPQLAQAASRLLLKGSRRWPAIRIKSKERALELLRRYVPGFDRKAGFDFRPSWSAGPNTYKNPLREAVGVDRSARHRKLSMFQIQPFDATAFLTLADPERLREMVDTWFRARIVYPGERVLPSSEGGNVACWLLNTLGQSAMGRNHSPVGLSVAA